MKFEFNVEGLKIAAEGKTAELGNVNMSIEMDTQEMIKLLQVEGDLIKDIFGMVKDLKESKPRKAETIYARRKDFE